MPQSRLPPEPAADLVAPLGRERQLAGIARAVENVQNGRAQFILIEGESGFGKTALLRAAARSVEDWPLRAAVADENETELPYGVLNQFLAGLDEPENLGSILGGGVAPDVSPMVAGAALLDLIDSSEGATCVTIDDAQWMDAQSAEALWFAGRRSFRDRLLVVITARPEETAFLERVRHLVADGERGIHLLVGGLSVDHVAELVRRRTGLPTPRRLATRLHAASDGNALHVQAILAQAASGADPLESLERVLTGTPPAAPGFRAITRETLRQLNPSARAILEVVAVLNSSATLTDIAAVASQFGGHDLTTADFDEALATGLITLSDNDEAVRMPHQRVRAVIVGDLSLQSTRSLHAAAGQVIGGHRGLAHRVHAAQGPDEELAVELDHAASLASGSHEVERAFRYARWAASLSRRPDDKERRTVDAGVYALAARRIGLLGPAVPDFENLRAGPERDVLLGNAALARADRISARQHLLAAASADVAATVRAQSMRASAAETLAQLALLEEDFDDSLRFAASALGAVKALDSLGLVSGFAALDIREMENNALCWGVLASWQRDGLADSLERLEELIAEAGRTGHRPEHSILFLTRGFIRRQQGRLSDAITDLETGIGLADLGRPELAPYGRIELAVTSFRKGEWDDAATAAAAAASLADDIQNPWLRATAHAVAAVVPAARGDAVAVDAWIAAAESGPEQTRTPAVERLARLARVLLARAAGDRDTVISLTAEALDTDPRNAQVEREWWAELLEEARTPAQAAHPSDPLAILSNREREVAHLAAQGLTNREVAQKLFVSVKGVEYHMGNVLAKLGINSRGGIRVLLDGRRAQPVPARRHTRESP
ncbi:DNA-binding CsgD family transcriptional regulator [Mycetocola sp. CAN_C7]|uniref:AAA family ATPase n=1 Tax=Mycetocola sp. CAN_C7 TaxID=2787724 RepID=UPI0018CB5BED